MNEDLVQQIIEFLNELTVEQRRAFLILACAMAEALNEQRKDTHDESTANF